MRSLSCETEENSLCIENGSGRRRRTASIAVADSNNNNNTDNIINIIVRPTEQCRSGHRVMRAATDRRRFESIGCGDWQTGRVTSTCVTKMVDKVIEIRARDRHSNAVGWRRRYTTIPSKTVVQIGKEKQQRFEIAILLNKTKEESSSFVLVLSI